MIEISTKLLICDIASVCCEHRGNVTAIYLIGKHVSPSIIVETLNFVIINWWGRPPPPMVKEKGLAKITFNY